MSLSVYLEIESCDKCGHADEVYWKNITHNLSRMASYVGIYEACWRPEEIGLKTGGDLIPFLERGLKELKKDPEGCRKFDSPNGWGRYEHFVEFVSDYLAACRKYPMAVIKVSR